MPRVLAVLVVLFALESSGCAAIEGIFKAGVWVGVASVTAIIILLAVVVALLRRG